MKPARIPASLLASAMAITLLLIPSSASALRLAPIGSFDQPVHVEDAPGKKNRKLLFVVEKPGRVIVVRGGAPQTFLDLTDLVLGPTATEQGLLSIAFHPSYERNRLFYVYLTNKAGHNAVYEFKRSKKSRTRAVRGSERLVMLIPHPNDASNHNGGQLQFGPDRLLYIAPGDGGSTPTAAQDVGSLNGKLLRINPLKQCFRIGDSRPSKCNPASYGIPKGNPFHPRGITGRSEIYALGLRNPFRFSFDAATGALVIGDVGGGDREEVDYRLRGRAAGANFGWPRFEGSLLQVPSVQAPGAIPPIFEYETGANGTCAIIGGYVARDRRLGSLRGRYLYSDVCRGEIRGLIPSEGGASGDASTGLTVPQLSSFGQGRGNVLFVASLEGPVYRLDP